jgi:hypothetical protein
MHSGHARHCRYRGPAKEAHTTPGGKQTKQQRKRKRLREEKAAAAAADTAAGAATKSTSGPSDIDVQADLLRRVKQLEAENAVLRNSSGAGEAPTDVGEPGTREQSKSTKRTKTKRASRGTTIQSEAVATPKSEPAAPAADISAWEGYGLDPLVVHSLAQQGFTSPTPIQHECLPAAVIGGADIVGAAQTVRPSQRNETHTRCNQRVLSAAAALIRQNHADSTITHCRRQPLHALSPTCARHTCRARARRSPSACPS